MRKSPTSFRRIFGGGLGAVSEFLELRAFPGFFSFTGRRESSEGFSDTSIFFFFFCLNFVSVGASIFAISGPGLVGSVAIFQVCNNIYPDTKKTCAYDTQAPRLEYNTLHSTEIDAISPE